MADLRVLIVDDEPLARRGIRQLLAQDPDAIVVGEARNGREATRALRELAPDLVFLDVQMPDLDGFGVLREHGVEGMPLVVFVTAHDEFAVQAFEAHAVDYLVKPLNAARFARTMTRVRDRHRAGAAMQLATQLGAMLTALGTDISREQPRWSGVHARYTRRLVVPAPTGDTVVDVDTIDWIEADDYYARLHIGRSQHLLRQSLAMLADQLDPEVFVRVHRSAIVRLDRIRRVQGTGRRVEVVLSDDTHVPVSRRRSAQLRALIRRQSRTGLDIRR
jgi:two-component system LytT family response regulator